MGLWNDLLVAMNTRRAGRIGSTEAEQLLAGRSRGTTHTGLAALLSEASGPSRPAELGGESSALAGFRRIRVAAPSTPALSTVDLVGRDRWSGPSPARTAAVRLAVVVLLLAAAGTVSVKLWYHPAHMQPSPGEVSSTSAPTPSPSPSSPPTGRVSSRPPATATQSGPRAAGSPAVAAQLSDLVGAVPLCRVWSATTDKATRDGAAQRLRPLIADVPGANGLPAFCRKLLAQPAPAGTTASGTTATGGTATGAATGGTATGAAANATGATHAAAATATGVTTPAANKSKKAKNSA